MKGAQTQHAPMTAACLRILYDAKHGTVRFRRWRIEIECWHDIIKEANQFSIDLAFYKPDGVRFAGLPVETFVADDKLKSQTVIELVW